MAFCQVKLWTEHVQSVMTEAPVDLKKRPPVKDDNTANKPPKEGLPHAGDFWNTTAPKYWIEREKAEKRDEQQANASWVALRTELKDKVAKHVKTFQLDPLPFPADDPDPQCYYSFTSLGRPWHTQIHRDAFGYGQVPANIDQRRVVDLRWFGFTPENTNNYVEFSTDNRDEFGMPQVSIQILPSLRLEIFCRAHGKSKTHVELTHLQPTFHFIEDKSNRQQDMRKE